MTTGRGRPAHWVRRHAVLLVALLLAASVRLPALRGQTLWVDELFSLAMATGHSLEHPAAAAVAEWGDYVEPASPVSAADVARYLEHEEPVAPAWRVLRAVRLSDTSPPLYYLLLWAWTQALGTGDAALRALSLLASLATLPVLAVVARRLGGRRAMAAALLLFAFAPAAVHYGTEGRMYSLLVLVAVAQAAATLRLRSRRRRRRLRRWATWVALAATGLWLHYFYIFVLAAMVLWLAMQRRRIRANSLALALCGVAILAAPWYLGIGTYLATWRVTAGWLDGRAGALEVLRALVALPGVLLGGDGIGLEWAWRPWPLAPLGLVASVALVVRAPSRARSFAGLWLAAACLGPLAFDLLRGTHTLLVPRYCLAGLPAAVLLVAVAATRFAAPVAIGVVGLWTACWIPALGAEIRASAREVEPYGWIASQLDVLSESDLVVVQSIPSGVAGVARYLRGSVPVLPWIPELGTRRLDRDLARAVQGRQRVAYVRIHDAGAPPGPLAWLDRRLKVIKRSRAGVAKIDLYATVSREPDRANRERAASGPQRALTRSTR